MSPEPPDHEPKPGDLSDTEKTLVGLQLKSKSN
jgi:hypothetical protein